MPVWTPEVEVDAELVGRLLRRFPELAGRPVRRLSGGWDRSVWLVDDAWVFGFPRRESVLPGLAREIELLPRLAPLLPLAVPVPTFVGEPAEGFPWPFWGAAFLPGVESCELEPELPARRRAATPLAAFLRALHDPALAAAVGAQALPVDANARGDMTRRVPLARTQLEAVRSAGLWDPPPHVEHVLAAAEALPAAAPAPDTLAHGDLHFRHVLMEPGTAGEGPRVVGILDWVDVCRADPGIDLQLYWSLFDPPERAAFLAAYGDVPPERLLRARVVALSVNAALAAYGHAEGLPRIARAAVEALTRSVLDR
jgi:aminoglycoside phosphotransferase (APT) family kinase protein